MRLADAVGNLFRAPTLSDRSYGAGGQLRQAGGTRYRYDAEGNLTSKTTAAGQQWHYTWDGAGQLVRVRLPSGYAVTFTYDALGRRVAKRYRGRVSRWVWASNVPLHEWHELEVGPEAGSVQELSTWLFEENSVAPAAKLTAQEAYSVVADHLGTPLALYDAQGQVNWAMQLDSYGAVRQGRGHAQACPFRYQGQYEDVETGLYYNRFRYYDPEIGQYISQDPIRLGGGMSLYSYVDNPNAWIDKFGLAKSPCSAGKYREVGGHHVHAKAAFKGDPNYNLNDAYAIGQDYMKNRGWDHSAMTSKQRELFDALATSGNPNTMAAHNEIAKEALIAGGASGQEAADLVQKSLDNLISQGVTSPARIPWN